MRIDVLADKIGGSGRGPHFAPGSHTPGQRTYVTHCDVSMGRKPQHAPVRKVQQEVVVCNGF